MSKFPFEVEFADILENPEPYVTSVISTLDSSFLVMPKGDGFIDYPIFEEGYEELKKVTNNFRNIAPESVIRAIIEKPISLIVLRAIVGIGPSEWAHLTTEQTDIKVTQGFARSWDRNIRLNPQISINNSSAAFKKINLMVQVACNLIKKGAPNVDSNFIHRMYKADTKGGIGGLNTLATMGVPYSMLLYERFLGRPFASHRDSVSDLIGDTLELAIEDILVKNGISYRKTSRAEIIPGFDQAPDFIIPNEFNPKIVIEAKITQDDGTARDKVTRIQHLGELSLSSSTDGAPKYEVIACIGGRGFGVRREDMRKMLIATRGKVFNLRTLDYLVECSKLKEYKC